MERDNRIELSALAWKAKVLPLYEPRINTIYMTNCFDINLHLNPLKEDIDIKSYGIDSHARLPISDINPDLIELFKSLDLKILLVEVFYTKPHRVTSIHIDARGGDYTKLNYIYGGKNSKMVWYKPKNDIKKSVSTTSIGTPYLEYKMSEVTKIEDKVVNFPSIIQAGIPHNIINQAEHRYCLSIVLIRNNDNRITMEESIELFSNYIIL